MSYSYEEEGWTTHCVIEEIEAYAIA
jgi:hypothetical protein